MTHKFAVGQLFTVKSGKVYRIVGLSFWNHETLKGEPGYCTRQLRDGKLYGPLRLTRESNVIPVADDSAADPLDDFNYVGSRHHY